MLTLIAMPGEVNESLVFKVPLGVPIAIGIRMNYKK